MGGGEKVWEGGKRVEHIRPAREILSRQITGRQV